MAADAHRELRELLGSYAVGALSRDEEARVLAHLDGCAECRELLADLRPVAMALTTIDPTQLAAEVPLPAPVEPLLTQVDGELGRLRRRRRAAAAGSATVAVAASALLALVLVGGDDPTGPVPVERQLRSASPDVRGTIGTLDRFWGTQLTLEATGLPDKKSVTIWMQRRDGTRVPAGTLLGLDDVPIKAQLSVSVRVRDAVAVGVSDDAGRTLLSSDLRR